MSGTAELAPRIGRQAGAHVNAPSDEGTWSTDPYAHALNTGQGPLFLRRADGWLLLLEIERWCAEPDAADLEVLRRCEGPVLDIGCGPGRLVAALSRQNEARYGSAPPLRGAGNCATSHDGAADDRQPIAPLPAERSVLGIDVSEAAITRTIARGASALHRSVFDPLPAEGRWGTALLIDGNIGIGGEPRILLDRIAQLLVPGGLLIAETVPAPDVDERVLVHVTDARGAAGHAFPWARLGTPALLRHAHRTGWRAVDQWTAGGRCFVALRSRSRNSTAEPPNSTAVSSSQRARKRSADRPVADA
ncbi:SAM-dependent methyltransferase [Streptomyces sp. NPDC001401]|uniref:SAM-dependent methyltransferase n=1 Tax=Streptomyces sp. NPDC001401 TaxID=3364570 RepID=UPI00367ED3D5